MDEIQRIVAIASPVVRNLEITYCYSRLAAACATRTGEGANWCTYATWASRQAGRTIRGEDLLEHLERRLGEGRWLLHPIATLWRRLLRRGLFQRETRIGRLTHELHTPFDAFERASDAVARGNLKVFEEIGLQFARYLHDRPRADLRPGDPPEGQRLLRQAFARYERLRSERDPKRRAELALLANLEIGLHEQTRLQPEILEALDAASATQAGSGSAGARRALSVRDALVAGRAASGRRRDRRLGARRSASREQARARGDHRLVHGPGAAGTRAGARDTPRRRVPGRAGRARRPGAERAAGAVRAGARRRPTTAARATGRTSHQRMHYIVHLFRAFHLSEQLSEPPFTPDQVASISRGHIPGGQL